MLELVIFCLVTLLLVCVAVLVAYRRLYLQNKPHTYRYYARKRGDLVGLTQMLEFLTANKKAADLCEERESPPLMLTGLNKNLHTSLQGQSYALTNHGIERLVIGDELLSIALACDDPAAILQIVVNKNGMDKTINGLLIRR